MWNHKIWKKIKKSHVQLAFQHIFFCLFQVPKNSIFVNTDPSLYITIVLTCDKFRSITWRWRVSKKGNWSISTKMNHLFVKYHTCGKSKFFTNKKKYSSSRICFWNGKIVCFVVYFFIKISTQQKLSGNQAYKFQKLCNMRGHYWQ